MENTKTKHRKYSYFVGIDISKNELDYAVIKGSELLFHKETKNEQESISLFVKELKTLPGFTINKAIFCMEDTGIYASHLLNCLRKVKANIIVENALHLKRSLGFARGKDDRIDAIRIAHYAKKNIDELTLWVPRRPVVEHLLSLFTIRNRLLNQCNALMTPLKEQHTFIEKGLQKLCTNSSKRSIAALKEDLADIDKAISQLIASDDHLKRLKTIITSVPNVGPVTATSMIICTGEFKEISDPKKFACYAGIAPFKNESGKMVRKPKVSHVANKKMKSLLHACALTSVRWDQELKTYYERKIKEGKAKMLVINAIRYKLILRVFACVSQDRCYIAGYVNSKSGNVLELDNPNKKELLKVHS
jgi:transposase